VDVSELVREPCVRESGEELEHDAVRPSEAGLDVILAAAAAFAGYHGVVLKFKDQLVRE